MLHLQYNPLRLQQNPDSNRSPIARIPGWTYNWRVTPGFELFDHTADIGIRVWAGSPDGLVEPAACGLYAVIGRLTPGEALGKATLEFCGAEDATLLRDFLAELLRRFERDQVMLVEATTLEHSPRRWSIRGTWRKVDVERSAFDREAKAVTYCDLALRHAPGGVEVRFVIDI